MSWEWGVGDLDWWSGEGEDEGDNRVGGSEGARIKVCQRDSRI
jgi:hypothetical protein